VRYTLKQLGCFVGALCLWLGSTVEGGRRQAEAVAAIRAAGGHVWYDDEPRGRQPAPGNWKDSFVPRWLRQFIPHDVYSVVDIVWICDVRAGGKLLEQLRNLPETRHLKLVNVGLTDESVEIVSRLHRLRTLNLDENRGLTDMGVAALSPLDDLDALSLDTTTVRGETLGLLRSAGTIRHLDLSCTPVFDAALESLGRFTQLESLSLIHTRIGDRGVRALRSVPSLRRLELDDTRATLEEVECLYRALPKIKGSPSDYLRSHF
jgi:hypothetical protein